MLVAVDQKPGCIRQYFEKSRNNSRYAHLYFLGAGPTPIFSIVVVPAGRELKAEGGS